jgi:hypothetical protein
VAVLLAVPAFALAACGGDSDEDKIKDIINDVSENAETLCDNATDKVLDQVGGSADECKKQAREAEAQDPDDGKPENIDVTVDGDKATAKFEDNDGEQQTVTFVKDGDDWKVDAIQ